MSSYENALSAKPEVVARMSADRQILLARETETFFMNQCLEEYGKKRLERWNRDYTSIDAYLASIEQNRRNWGKLLGDYQVMVEDMAPETEPFYEDDSVKAEYLSIRIAEELRGRGILALPKKAQGPVPLVICQHGYSTTPANCFGFNDTGEGHHSFGRRLAESGYAVLAPYNILNGGPRARFHRYSSLIKKTLFGLETFRTSRFLDYLGTLPEIDSERIGMWGLSLGGTATIFTAALETRIKVAIIAGWFNNRLKRMIIEDYHRASYLVEDVGEHLYLNGWMLEFGDCDLISLICPRAVQVQAGRCDRSIWWPDAVEEFELSKEHYDRLGISDRCELDLHGNGHEVDLKGGMAFLEKNL